MDTNGNGYLDADELASGMNPFARPGESGYVDASNAGGSNGGNGGGIAPIWDSDDDFSPDFEEIAAGTSPMFKYSAPVVLTCQKFDRYAEFDSAGSWRELELGRILGWERAWDGVHDKMLLWSPPSLMAGTTPRTLAGFMSDFASGWENPNPESGKGLPPQSLLEEYFMLPALIARQVKPVAGNPSVTSGYIRAIGDRYRLRGPLSSEDQHRQFLKVTWTQTTGFNENQFVEDAASSLMGQPLLEQEPTSVEVVTLTIPRGSLYSAPHDVVPQYSVPNGPANPEMPHSQVGEYLKVVRLLPVELATDINNDGVVNSSDSGLAAGAFKQGATEAEIDKATEYMFANDQLSNGAWDKEDNDADKPASETGDDDAEELLVKFAMSPGDVWFEHPAIDSLSFYRTKECKAADKENIKASAKFDLSAKSLPDKLYVRADGTLNVPADNMQKEGNLVLKFKPSGGQEVELAKLKITVIKELGGKKYFHGARDYIAERNTRFFARDKAYGSSVSFRVVGMREEATKMYPIDAARRASGVPLKGIEQVNAEFQGQIHVAVNGNMNFFSDDRFNGFIGNLAAAAQGLITDRCHGRIVRMNTYDSAVSSDNTDTSTAPAGSAFAGEQYGRYVAQYDQQNKFVFAAGRVPLASTAPDQPTGGPSAAMGGLSTNYSDSNRTDREYQFIGYAKCAEENKGIVFTATQITGTGSGPSLAEDAKKSGVSSLPGGDADDIQILLLDGGTSTALAYAKPTTPNDTLKTAVKEGKHINLYYINTYLLFHCAKPRP